MPADTSDEIRLVIPAHHAYGRIARIATAALALRLGFSYREVQDLRLAIDEALILLLGQDSQALGLGVNEAHDLGRVEIRFVVDRHTMVLHIRADFETQLSLTSKERFAELLSDLVDEWFLSDDERSLRLSKVHVADGVG